MNSPEQYAKTIIEALIPGARMKFHPDQSAGKYDFDLEYADGTFAHNRKKLGSAGWFERHLFTYVSPHDFLAWTALVGGDLPNIAPPLADEITDVWAATAGNRGNGYHVWSGVRDQRWEKFGTAEARSV